MLMGQLLSSSRTFTHTHVRLTEGLALCLHDDYLSPSGFFPSPSRGPLRGPSPSRGGGGGCLWHSHLQPFSAGGGRGGGGPFGRFPSPSPSRGGGGGLGSGQAQHSLSPSRFPPWSPRGRSPSPFFCPSPRGGGGRFSPSSWARRGRARMTDTRAASNILIVMWLLLRSSRSVLLNGTGRKTIVGESRGGILFLGAPEGELLAGLVGFDAAQVAVHHFAHAVDVLVQDRGVGLGLGPAEEHDDVPAGFTARAERDDVARAAVLPLDLLAEIVSVDPA